MSNNAVPTEKLAVPVKVAAAMVGMPETSLRDILARCEIPQVRYGTGTRRQRILVPVAGLVAWLDRHTVEVRR